MSGAAGLAGTRVGRLLAVVRDHRGEDPYLHGRAMQVAGRALLAEALVVPENPLAPGRRGTGLPGALLVAVAGGLVVLVAVPAVAGSEVLAVGPRLAGVPLVVRAVLGLGWTLALFGTLLALPLLLGTVVGAVLLVRGGRLVRTRPSTPAGHVVTELRRGWDGRADAPA